MSLMRTYRRALGLSQSAFAAQLNVPLETYRPWDAGRREPPPQLLTRARTLAAMVGAPFVGPEKGLVYAPHRSQNLFFFDPTSLLEVDIDPDWAMVGAPFVGPEKGLVYAPHRSRRCEDVVDTPSDVPLARTAPLPPPRVMARRLGMQGAKGIHPARVDPAVEFGPLLGEEPAVRDIRLRARQVDHAVRRVVVADHEHRAQTPQRLRSGEDRPREVELVAVGVDIDL